MDLIRYSPGNLNSMFCDYPRYKSRVKTFFHTPGPAGRRLIAGAIGGGSRISTFSVIGMTISVAARER